MANPDYEGFNMNQQSTGQYYYDQTQSQMEGSNMGTGQQMHAQPLGKNQRPYVDPEAMGEVDPSSYPAPKESTDKIRGRSDLMEMFCQGVTQELLIAKTFYFFFFSAFGSLFPLMAVYFKQMAMNPAQTGILIGVRPFVEFLSTPFWGSIAEK